MRVIRDVPVIVHADDYGETYNTCIEMLELIRGGYLDGISLITNMRDLERYTDLFLRSVPDMPRLPLINIHLNLVEGRYLGRDTDDEGDEECLPWTWMSLFKTSFRLPAGDRNGAPMRYKETYNALLGEIRSQISRGAEFIRRAQEAARDSGIPYTPQKLRIDSHQHVHMVPIVWRALMQVISEDGLEVDYIRNAHEPLGPFLKDKKCFNIVGMMKNRILAINAPKVEDYIRQNIGKPNYLCGLMMSGHMDAVRLSTVLPGILRACAKRGYGLEINIHPAMMLESEVTEEIPYDSAMNFYTSPDRHLEALTVRTMQGVFDRLESGEDT